MRSTAAPICSGVTAVYGDARNAADVALALKPGFDTVFTCLGSGALKPSTLMTQSTQAILAAMHGAGINRLIAVSGTAEMPDQTRWGRIYTAILTRTPVGHAVRDHDGAAALVRASDVSWVLVGCNYIANGAAKGHYRTATVFPGGFKTIKAGDVADFMLHEAMDRKYHQQAVGLWY